MQMSDLRLIESFAYGKTIYDFITKVTLLIVAFLAPIQGLLTVLAVLIFLDLLTGVLASVKQKQSLTSAKLSRTITKTMMYLFTIVLVHMIAKHVLLKDDLPLTAMVSSFIILTEFQSILENLNRITKQNFITILINHVSLVTKGRIIQTSDNRPTKKRRRRKRKVVVKSETQKEE
jgi:phage-related holin